MVKLVFGFITMMTLMVLFSQGFGAALAFGMVMSIMGLLFCLPWIALGDPGGRESGE
jgi:hypothetical protein